MVATQPKTRGSVVMAVGVLMVIFAVITMLINSDPLPMPMVIIGLVSWSFNMDPPIRRKPART